MLSRPELWLWFAICLAILIGYMLKPDMDPVVAKLWHGFVQYVRENRGLLKEFAKAAIPIGLSLLVTLWFWIQQPEPGRRIVEMFMALWICLLVLHYRFLKNRQKGETNGTHC